MNLVRRLSTRRFVSLVVSLCFGLYGIESELADVHDGGVDTGAGSQVYSDDLGLQTPEAPRGSHSESDNHPVHVCHCGHTHLVALATAPSLDLVIKPEPRASWGVSAVLPSAHSSPRLRPPIA